MKTLEEATEHPAVGPLLETPVMQHTPGPWRAHFEEAYFVTGPDLGRVAMMMNLKGSYGLGGRRSGDESAANCRLIAAAPALLNALLDLTSQVEVFAARHGEADFETNRARAALRLVGAA